MKRVRHLAFYLPQYHPIPENDAWWGQGFTDWHSVTRARPRFRGHDQPHLPADLGFYDLRLGEVREAQAELARTYGIDGFVYYHYWFSAHRPLGRPFEEVLASGQPDFPFCLCWANESWTRTWGPTYGSSPKTATGDVLLEQRYSLQDDVAHLRWLATAFTDPRYIRIGGRPMLLVFRASVLPEPRRTTDTWREEAHRLGLGELYLCRVEASTADREDPRPLGFDAAVAFQPDRLRRGRQLNANPTQAAWWSLRLTGSPARRDYLFDYSTVVEQALTRPGAPYTRHPCVMPAWDNSPRRPRGATIVTGATPARYAHWVRTTSLRLRPGSSDDALLFINAWNEWSEGAHLEPDQRWGRGYLEAHREAADYRSVSASLRHPTVEPGSLAEVNQT